MESVEKILNMALNRGARFDIMSPLPEMEVQRWKSAPAKLP